ncbi:MAG: hypothetical protein HYU29_04925 [Chloroflexi bacterium]|nr:hypothetical protein [Chloroflexota bacterium]
MHEPRDGRHAITETLPETPQEVTEKVLHNHLATGPLFRVAAVFCGVLLLLGVVGFILRVAGGFDDRTKWGYYGAIFFYILTTAQAAPIVSVAMRMAKNHWRRPLARAAELYAIVGVLNLLIFIPLLFVLPSAAGRRSLWLDGAARMNAGGSGWPPLAPHLWIALMLAGLVFLGLALLYTAALPDLATVRDHSTSKRHSMLRRLTLGWRGTPFQWRAHRAALGVLGGLYFMFYISTHSFIAIDYGVALVPGWKDSIFPAFQVLSSLQSALAITLVTMFFLRQTGGYKEFFYVDPFWALSKILLATTILWFYFWWASFFTFWYGRTQAEQNVLQLLMFGPYRPLFILAFLFSFLLPFLLLIWNAVRKSILGPTVAAALVLAGNFFDRLRVYVASFSVEDIRAHQLESVPAAHLPDGADILIILGALGGLVLFYLVGTRLVPVLSMWELKEYLTLRRIRPFLKTHVRVMAKPE